VVRGDKLFAGFLSLITGPMIRIKNRRINETLPSVVDQGTLSNNLETKINAKENIPTIVC